MAQPPGPGTNTTSEVTVPAAIAAEARAPARSGSRRRNWLIAAGTLVVVVGVVVGLTLTGVVPLLPDHGSTPNGALAEPYSNAVAAANRLAASTAGGPWNLSIAEAADLTTAYTASPPSGCTVSNGPNSAPIGAYRGNYSTGAFATWYFVYRNFAATVDLLINVVNDTTVAAGTITATTTCQYPFDTEPLRTGGASIMDSDRIAADADATPSFASYLHTHSFSNVSIALSASIRVPTIWYLSYTTCNPVDLESGNPQNGTRVTALFNATSGVEISNSSYPSDYPCDGIGTPPPVPIGTAFAVGALVLATCPYGDSYAENGCAAEHYYYSLTIEMSTVTFDSVEFEVLTPGGLVLTTAEANGFSILNVTGAVVAQSSPSTTMAMTSSFGFPVATVFPATALSTQCSIRIDIGTVDPTGQDYALVVLGTGDYSGSTNPITLP